MNSALCTCRGRMQLQLRDLRVSEELSFEVLAEKSHDGYTYLVVAKTKDNTYICLRYIWESHDQGCWIVRYDIYDGTADDAIRWIGQTHYEDIDCRIDPLKVVLEVIREVERETDAWHTKEIKLMGVRVKRIQNYHIDTRSEDYRILYLRTWVSALRFTCEGSVVAIVAGTGHFKIKNMVDLYDPGSIDEIERLIRMSL